MHQGWDDAAGGAGEEPSAGETCLPNAAADSKPEPQRQSAPEAGAEPDPDTEPEPGAEPGPDVKPEPGAVPVEVSEVLAKLAQIQRLADEVMASPLWQHSNPQSVAAVKESAVAARKVQAAHLTLIADMDTRTGTLPGAPAGYEARTYLRHGLLRTMGQAKADLSAAHLLHPDAEAGQQGLPRLGAAFGAGHVSREHVDAAVRIMQRLPKKLLAVPMHAEDGTPLLDEDGTEMCAGDVIDEKITTHAKTYDSYALTQLAIQLKETLDPDGSFDPAACVKRGLRLHWDHAGMLILRGELGAAEGALLLSVIDQLADPKRDRCEGEDEDGTRLAVPDTRTIPQRQADALMELVDAGRAGTTAGTRGGEPPRITLITRPDDLATARAAHTPARTAGTPGTGAAGEPGTGPAGTTGPSSPRGSSASNASSGPAEPASPASPADSGTPFDGDGGYLGTGTHISPRLLALLSCDAILQRALLAANGAVLNLGREVRTITPAQRRALTARDRGCSIPGCTVPAAWCHGHHVQWWSNDGPTDIGNLALLCPRHHTEVHSGIWVLTMKHGVPWAIPPDWINSRQRPLRNPYPHDLHDMRNLGTQLRLNLDGGAASGGGPPSSRGSMSDDESASSTDADPTEPPDPGDP